MRESVYNVTVKTQNQPSTAVPKIVILKLFSKRIAVNNFRFEW